MNAPTTSVKMTPTASGGGIGRFNVGMYDNNNDDILVYWNPAGRYRVLQNLTPAI